MPQLADLVTAREARDLLGYKDVSSITRLIGYGKLTPVRRDPLMFDRADVEQLAAERKAS